MQPNKGRFCTTIASVVLFHTSIKKKLCASNDGDVYPSLMARQTGQKH